MRFDAMGLDELLGCAHRTTLHHVWLIGRVLFSAQEVLDWVCQVEFGVVAFWAHWPETFDFVPLDPPEHRVQALPPVPGLVIVGMRK